MSLPVPPATRSEPSPPQMRSLPPRPLMTSLPPKAWMTSLPGVPLIVWLAEVPTMVAFTPPHVALAGVGVGDEATLDTVFVDTVWAAICASVHGNVTHSWLENNVVWSWCEERFGFSD